MELMIWIFSNCFKLQFLIDYWMVCQNYSFYKYQII